MVIRKHECNLPPDFRFVVAHLHENACLTSISVSRGTLSEFLSAI